MHMNESLFQEGPPNSKSEMQGFLPPTLGRPSAIVIATIARNLIWSPKCWPNCVLFQVELGAVFLMVSTRGAKSWLRSTFFAHLLCFVDADWSSSTKNNLLKSASGWLKRIDLRHKWKLVGEEAHQIHLLQSFEGIIFNEPFDAHYSQHRYSFHEMIGNAIAKEKQFSKWTTEWQLALELFCTRITLNSGGMQNFYDSPSSSN